MATGSTLAKPCYGCGAIVPDSDGPVHRYLGAAAGCWAVYGEVLARQYAAAGYSDRGLLVTNSYMVQHPGRPSPQTIQSVAVHLIGLWLALEREASQSEIVAGMRRAADGSERFQWLEPPVDRYPTVIVAIHRAASPETAANLSAQMARETWAIWEAAQPQVRRWAAELGLA